MRRRHLKLVGASRILKRCKGAGAPSLMDTEDEEYVANAIEGKCYYHGRRNDATVYDDRRIKTKDLVSIANYSRYKRGLKLIKSSKTVMLRAKPRNVRSIEGKKHSGKWLSCTRKPTTENAKNESIHYNRAAVKIVRQEYA